MVYINHAVFQNSISTNIIMARAILSFFLRLLGNVIKGLVGLLLLVKIIKYELIWNAKDMQ